MRSIRGLHVIRGGVGVPRLAVRADDAESEGDDTVPADGRLGTLEVDFSRFGVWYEIDSWWEGRFIEQTARGAFANTIGRAKRSNGNFDTKVMFNHGFDFNIGDKLLGVPEVLEEREESPHLEAPLEDTSYNRDLAPLLRKGGYGSSFMFEVLSESWVREPEASDYNPDALPERTLTEVRLYEAGPVTWPANPEATAGLRMQSGMDWYAAQLRLRGDEEAAGELYDEQCAAQYEELVRSLSAFRAYHGLRRANAPVSSLEKPNPVTLAAGDPPARHVEGVSAAARARRLTLIDMAGR